MELIGGWELGELGSQDNVNLDFSSDQELLFTLPYPTIPYLLYLPFIFFLSFFTSLHYPRPMRIYINWPPY